MMTRALDIYWSDQLVGRLEQVDSRYRFAYDAAYAASPMPPVSLTLPKSQIVHESVVLFPCFSNLLPEGANRATICKRHQIDEQDAFGLLMLFAGRGIIGNLEFRLVR
jgi:serine/threonine-protein kinase HipA